MIVTCAQDFLRDYAGLFGSDVIAGWGWSDDDDQFGHLLSWQLRRSDAIDAMATVDLMAGQLQLTITERSLGEGDGLGQDTDVVFNAFASFDERTIAIDGNGLPYTDQSFRSMIAAFHERTA